MRRPLRRSKLPAQRLKSGRITVVAVDIAQKTAKSVECRGIKSTVGLKAILHPVLELVESPTGLGYTDDRHIKVAALL